MKKLLMTIIAVLFFANLLKSQALEQSLSQLQEKLKNLQNQLKPISSKKFEQLQNQIEAVFIALVEFEKNPSEELFEYLIMITDQLEWNVEDFSYRQLFTLERIFLKPLIERCNAVHKKLWATDKSLAKEFKEYMVDYFTQIRTTIQQYIHTHYPFEEAVDAVHFSVNKFVAKIAVPTICAIAGT